MKKQIAVIGLGRFGRSVAVELLRQGQEVVGMDKSEKAVNNVLVDIPDSLILDATSERALIDADVGSFDVAVVAIGENKEASILTTLMLKEHGVPLVVSRAQDRYHEIILERVGADRVVQPEAEIGVRLAHRLSSPNILNLMELEPGFSIAEILAPESMHNKTLTDLKMRQNAGLNVLAIIRNNVLNSVPQGDDIIKPDDKLIVTGPDEKINNLKKL